MNKALRKAVIAGNWKMNKTPSEAKALIEEMKPLVKNADCDVVLCVPYIDIPAAVEAAKGSNIKSVRKIFTLRLRVHLPARFGRLLKEAGVEYVIVGHSERKNILR